MNELEILELTFDALHPVTYLLFSAPAPFFYKKTDNLPPQMLKISGLYNYGAPVIESLISVRLMILEWQVTLDSMEKFVPIEHDVGPVRPLMKPFL